MHQPLSRKTVSFYRGWKAWTASKRSWEEGLWVLVDNLDDKSIRGEAFESETQIRLRLDELIDEAAALGDGKALNKFLQSKAYLDGVAHKDPLAHCRQFSLPVERISDEELAAMKAEIPSSPEMLRVARESNFTPQEIKTMMQASYQKHFANLEQALKGLQTPNFTIGEAYYESSWTNLVTPDDGVIKVYLNTFRTSGCSRALISFLALHEIIGHVVHYTQLKQHARTASFHELQLAVHTEDSYFLEGVAQLISAFLMESLTDAEEESLEKYALRSTDFFAAVRHSNVVEVFSGNLTVEQAVARHLDFCGGETDRVRLNYSLIFDGSFIRNQILSYYSSYALLKPILALPMASQVDAIAYLLGTPSSVKEMAELVNRYQVGPING